MSGRLLIAALLLAPFAAPPAGATVVRTFSLRAMTVAADAVVRGEVVDEEVVYDARWGRVYTHTTVRVDETLLGAARPGTFLVVRQIGGMLDGIESRVVGTAPLQLGSEVVLFTRTDGALHYLVGMAQGAYAVVRHAGKPATLSRDVGRVHLLTHPLAGRPAPDRESLATFRQRVLEAASTRGARR